MTEIKKLDISIPVKVRKYEVDIVGLKELLKTHKKASKLSNKQIAEKMDKPITLIEHWFRGDKSFAIPDADVWEDLKKLLNIQSNEFDLSITEFEEKPGEYDQRNRIYLTDGIAPTLTTGSEVLILDERKHVRIGSLWPGRQAGGVWDKEGVAPTLKTPSGGYSEPMVITEGENTLKTLRVNDLFCGAGGMGIGFKQAGYETAGAWDFDKYAVQAYAHNVDPVVKELSILDMSWEDVPQADVWTFGFPCQDLSIAGKQAGLFEGKRSGLFFEVMRLLDETIENDFDRLPSVIMAENVKGLKPYLGVLEEEYQKRGYKMYLSDQNNGVFNTKFWGLPQNRERYFVVGVHESIEKEFKFPVQQEDYIPRLSTVLEPEVDEKYYISDEKASKIIEQAKEGLKVKQATKKGYDIAVEGDSVNLSHPNSKTRRGRVGKQVAQTLLTGQEQVVVEGKCFAMRGRYNEDGTTSQQIEPRKDYCTSTLTGVQKDNMLIDNDFRVRKLTPREYLRLQGFPEDFEIVVSDSQTYKQAGNSCSVPVVRAIAERIKMFLLSL